MTTDVTRLRPIDTILSRVFSVFSRKSGRTDGEERYDAFTRRRIQDLPPHIRRDIGWYD